MKIGIKILAFLLLSSLAACESDDKTPTEPTPEDNRNNTDMLTPAYYTLDEDDDFIREVNNVLFNAQKLSIQNPFKRPDGLTPIMDVPDNGKFGAGKGPTGTSEHHNAVDLHYPNARTNVPMYAAHDGVAATFRDAPKFRQFLSITKDIIDGRGLNVGKMVTIYAHIDLDLDEADGRFMDGETVEEGDLVSHHLYAETLGGPHLHFEIRYYRATDIGTEDFYGTAPPFGNDDFTVPSAGSWLYGAWNPDVGYGFGHPQSHGLSFYNYDD